MSKDRQSRREFIGQGLAASAGYGIASGLSTSCLGNTSGVDQRVRLGFIGLGHRGDALIDAFLVHADAQITALCDLYDPYIEFAKQKVDGNPFVTKDYRQLLDRKDVDAVVVATPDHWHALHMTEACAAGKDVYVEKPLAFTVAEGQKMVELARRYERITQVGLQRRSQPVCQRTVELIASGAIGRVVSCHCFHVRNESPMGIGDPSDSAPPPGFDWDQWLGPAPKVPYNENRCFYKFRWFRDYSGGQITNWGTHLLDMIQWAIGQDAPVEINAMGSSAGIDDNREIPVTMQVNWKYPDSTMVSYTQFNANGAPCNPRASRLEFRGTKGTLYHQGRKIEVVPETVRTQPHPAMSPLFRKENTQQQRAVKKALDKPLRENGTYGPNGDDTSSHTRDFLDGVKSRRPCRCPVEVGHRSTTTTLLGTIALDLKRHLVWDSEREEVIADPEANKRLSYEYRAPWKLPG